MRLLLKCGVIPLLAIVASIAAQPLLEALVPSLGSLQLFGLGGASYVPTVLLVLLGTAAGFLLRPIVSTRRSLLAVMAAPLGWLLFVLWILFGGTVPGMPIFVPYFVITGLAPGAGIGLGLLMRRSQGVSHASV